MEAPYRSWWEVVRQGQWCYRIELPANAAGTRRPRRRDGFASATDAQGELDRVRDLLAIPDPDDEDALRKVGDLIAETISAKKTMPEVDTVRRLGDVRGERADVPVFHPLRLMFGGAGFGC